MKFITLIMCSLGTLISQNMINIQNNESRWNHFQQMIKNQDYINKFNIVEKSWNKISLEKQDMSIKGYEGILIEPAYFRQFYNRFKTFLDATNDIFRKFDNIQIIILHDNTLDEIYKIHRKNPIDFDEAEGDLEIIFKKNATLFSIHEKAWNMTKNIYHGLRQITKEQFQ